MLLSVPFDFLKPFPYLWNQRCHPQNSRRMLIVNAISIFFIRLFFLSLDHQEAREIPFVFKSKLLYTILIHPSRACESGLFILCLIVKLYEILHYFLHVQTLFKARLSHFIRIRM